jgi:hypothetical protein
MGAHGNITDMANLAAAVKAYRAAQTAVERAEAAAAARTKAARQAREQARKRLAAAIVDAALGGMRQVEIIEETGYSRERVRTILREGGVEPD